MISRLMIDTNVWLDLVKDYRVAAPVVTAIEDLITAGAIELIVPQIVLDEFARNLDRVVKESTQSLSSHFKQVREVVSLVGDAETKADLLKQLQEVDHKIAMGGDVPKAAIAHVEKVMATIAPIPTSDAVKIKAAERALSKKAPFHLPKNSMGDALIIETYAAALEGVGSADDSFIFVTGNKSDFSRHNGDKRFPHADLEPLFQAPRSHYSISIVDVLKDIDAEMLMEYEWEHTFQHNPRKLSELLEAAHLLDRQVWYNRHWNLRAGIEDGKIRIITAEESRKLEGYHPEVIVDKIWEGALAAAKRTEVEVGLENLGPWDDFEWGMVNGKLSALRWVLGDDWDMLDT
jgi:predicted nucleic acid-binding protein